MFWIYGSGIVVILATFILDKWLHVDYVLAAAWSLTICAMAITVFTVRYWIWSNWRANPIGVILLTKSIFLTTMIWQIVVSTWWSSDYPFRQQIRFVIYALGALAYITMTVTLIAEQHRGKRRKAEIL